jgi:hypothetical protein
LKGLFVSGTRNEFRLVKETPPAGKRHSERRRIGSWAEKFNANLYGLRSIAEPAGSFSSSRLWGTTGGHSAPSESAIAHPPSELAAITRAISRSFQLISVETEPDAKLAQVP